MTANAGPARASDARFQADARATVAVRIVNATRVTLGRSANAPHLLSQATVRLEDGSRAAARLVEFE